MSRDLRCRVDYEPLSAGSTLARTWLGPELLWQFTVSNTSEARAQLGTRADRINALIDARVTELIEANNALIERARIAEAEVERLRQQLADAAQRIEILAGRIVVALGEESPQ